MRRLFLTTTLLFALSLVLTGIVSASVNQSPTSITTGLNSGLVGWWTFDGDTTNGSYWRDVSGQCGDLVKTNTIKNVSGKIGQAFYAPYSASVRNYASFSCSKNLTTSTMSFWVKAKSFPSATYQDIVSPNGSSDVGGFHIYGNSPGYIQWYYVGNGTTVLGGVDTNISLNKWYHVVATTDGATGQIYINGVKKVDSAIVGGGNFTAAGPWVGCRFQTECGDAVIDDFRVWTRVLSAKEIQQLYKQGAAGKTNQAPTNITTGLNTGLVGWWTFDGADCNATICLDKSVYGNAATKQGTVTKVKGKIGQGLSYPGANDNYMLIGDVPALKITGSHSIVAWFKTNNTSTYQTIYSKNQGGVGGYFAGLYLGRIFEQINVTYTEAGNLVPDKNWHFMVTTYDGTNIRTYLDGVLGQTKESAAPVDNTNNAMIGYVPSTAPFNGLIDDVRVYSRALSPAEIQQLYKQGAAGKTNQSPTNVTTNLNTGLVGWWTFDGADVTSTQVLDKSGNLNHGTRAGGVVMAKGKIGQAGSFDGTDDVVSLSSQIRLNSTSTFGVSFWYKGTESGGQSNGHTLLGRDNGDTYADIVIKAGNIGLIRYSGAAWNGDLLSTNSLKDNKWHHIVYVNFADVTGKLYVDGVLDKSGSSAIDNTIYPLRIDHMMRGYNNMYQSGSLDDVRVYNRTLSASEVMQLYKMGK